VDGRSKLETLTRAIGSVKKTGGVWTPELDKLFHDTWAATLLSHPLQFSHRDVKQAGGRRFAVGDTHGCLDTLKQLMAEIHFTTTDVMYLVGDYLDRGPKVKELLDFLMAQQRTHKIYPLRGNHEQVFLQLYDGRPCKATEADWVRKYGGAATLHSFNAVCIADIPAKYIKWLRGLKLYAKTAEYVLSHAGVNLNVDAPFANTPDNEESILWTRKVPRPKHGKLRIVCGHTPMSLASIRKSADTTKVYIDGGCARGGYLVAFNMDTHKITAVKTKDVRLRYDISGLNLPD
jgi:serine/threonine protein phosphatase 1